MAKPVAGSNHVDDILFASDGTNFNGHGGIDMLVFDGSFFDYIIRLQNAENLKATITDSGGDVIDSKQIEFFRFDDGTYDVATGAFTPSVPSISVSDASVVEGGQLRFVLSLSAISSEDITGHVRTAPGTASGMGVDFNGFMSLAFTIPAGQQSIEIVVQTRQDTLDEPNETMALLINDVAGATIADDKGVGTIIDDDVPPPPVTHVSFYADANNIEEGNPLTFHFHRDVADTALDVRYVISTFPGGGATPGEDFTAGGTVFTEVTPGQWADTTMVVHFAAGQTDAVLVFETINDGLVEQFGEAFAVQFDFANNAPNVVFDSAQSEASYLAAFPDANPTQVNIGHIVDPPLPTHVSLYADANNITEGDELTVHFHRDVTDTALDVRYTISTFPAGGATPGEDFTADGTVFTEVAPGQWADTTMIVHFEAGQADAVLVFDTIDDGLEEPFGEAFAVHFDFENNAPDVIFDGAESETLYLAAFPGANPTQVNIGHIVDII